MRTRSGVRPPRPLLACAVLLGLASIWLIWGQGKGWLWWALAPLVLGTLVWWLVGLVISAGRVLDGMPLGEPGDPPDSQGDDATRADPTGDDVPADGPASTDS